MADAKDAPQIIEHISKSVNFTPFVVRWVPCRFVVAIRMNKTLSCHHSIDRVLSCVSARLVVLGSMPKGTGAMQVYQMEHGKLNLLAEVRVSPIQTSNEPSQFNRCLCSFDWGTA